MEGLNAVILLIGTSGFLLLPIILKLRKIFLQCSLQQRLEALKNEHHSQASRCNGVRHLAADYYNSVGIETHCAISEMDKILVNLSTEIRDIEFLIEKADSRSLQLANQKLDRYQGVKKIAEQGSDEASFRQPTWEYKVNNLVKRTGTRLMEVSKKAQSTGICVKHRNRKSTALILHEIAAI